MAAVSSEGSKTSLRGVELRESGEEDGEGGVAAPVSPRGQARKGEYGALATNPATAAGNNYLRMDVTQSGIGLSRRTILMVTGVVVVLAVVLGVALGLGLAQSGSDAEDGCTYTDYQLRPAASPTSYNVYWKPQFTSPYAVNGFSEIVMTMTASGQNCVQVHAANMLIVSAEVAMGATGAYESVGWTLNVPSTQRIIVRLPRTANEGETVTMLLTFETTLAENNVGLYRSSYTDDGGSQVNIAVTHFEATFARNAFPCFDEPVYKAQFNVTMDGVPSTHTALSNMPVAARKLNPLDGTYHYTFQPSPLMSTYLVAAVVSPLVSVSTVAGANNVNVSVHAVARGDNGPRLQYALAAAATVLEYYESVFEVPFPLPKLDMMACPDFAAGAMESALDAGLVTTRKPIHT